MWPEKVQGSCFRGGPERLRTLVKFSHLDEMFFSGWGWLAIYKGQKVPGDSSLRLSTWLPSRVLQEHPVSSSSHQGIFTLITAIGFRILRWPQTPKLHQTLPPLMFFAQAQSQGWDTEELNRAAVEAYCTNPLYEYRAVPGPHHVHLNNPEIVAGPIADFLERHNNLGGGDS